ncbi:MAG: ComF family protein [Candidatus Pacebacteria bacterium]|nr:ComF family protein [Candidatus Paceibacterota bacterium]
MNLLKKCKEKIVETLFPAWCLNCHKEGMALCSDCLSLIEINPWQHCPFCPKPKRVINKGKCGSHQHFALDGLFSAVSYQDPLVKKIIRAFKYQPFLKNLDQQLIQIILAHFQISENKILFHSQDNSCLIAIPISKSKLKRRGYNQSSLLAKGLSTFYQIPILENILIKTKETKSQVSLSKEERKENLAGAFSITSSEIIKNKIIFLVDDVFTTGATMEEAAKTLKRAGAKKVFGIAVAREGLN